MWGIGEQGRRARDETHDGRLRRRTFIVMSKEMALETSRTSSSA